MSPISILIQIKSLPLAVWVPGGAIWGTIVVFLALSLLESLAIVIARFWARCGVTAFTGADLPESRLE